MSIAPPREDFYARASVEIEGVVHRIRVALLCLVQLRLLVFFGGRFLEGEQKHLLTSGVIGLGVLASAVIVRQVRRSRGAEGWTMASVALDASLAFLIVLPSVAWPRPEYRGLLLAPDFSIWPLLALGSGLRLSARVGLVGGAAALGALAGLSTLDSVWNASRIAYGAPEMAIALVFVVSGSALAIGVSGWVRGLVGRGTIEAVAAERARQRLGAYVSTEVAELAMTEETVLGGSAREVAIVFSDLRGFTLAGERATPDALLAELNAYLEVMVGVIHQHGGVVDKYMGDAILAVFGIPERRGDEAGRAIRAAVGMMEALEAHNGVRAARGTAPLAHGIGVHFGRVVAGHVGTPERLQYTVIGDVVNVASRLQTTTKEVGAPVLISDAAVQKATADGSAMPPLRALEPVTLRGRSVALAVHTLR